MKTRNLALLLVALLATVNPLFAAEPGFATVDLRMLLILHPEMKDFDYINGRFLRADISQKNAPEVRAQLEAMRKSTSPTIEKLLNKQSQLAQTRAETFVNKSNFVNRVLNNKPDESAKTRKLVNQAKKDYSAWSHKTFVELANPKTEIQIPQSKEEKSQMILEVDKKFKAQIASLDLELQDIGDQLKVAREEMFSPVYFTTAETIRKLRKIKEEISGLITQSASEKGIQIVMDTSFGSNQIRKADELTTLPFQPDTPDLISSKLFHNFANWKPRENLPFDANGLPINPEHMAVNMQSNKIEEFKKYIESRFYLPEMADVNFGRMFLVGGVDLTPEIAQKIFSKYSVPAPMATALLSVVKSFSSINPDKASSN